MDRALEKAVKKASPPFQWREKPWLKSTANRRMVRSVGACAAVFMELILEISQNLSIIQVFKPSTTRNLLMFYSRSSHGQADSKNQA
jgi:hypothetical protein